MFRKLGGLLPLVRCEVEGESMVPELASGDRVLVNKLAYWFSRPREGDIVVVRHPRERSRLLVKRIEAAVGCERWAVIGVNPKASTDSRHFGPVGRELIVGKVWTRY